MRGGLLLLLLPLSAADPQAPTAAPPLDSSPTLTVACETPGLELADRVELLYAATLSRLPTATERTVRDTRVPPAPAVQAVYSTSYCDNAVYAFSFGTGKLLATLYAPQHRPNSSTPAAGLLFQPAGLEVGPDGNLYVTDLAAVFGYGQVLRYTSADDYGVNLNSTGTSGADKLSSNSKVDLGSATWAVTLGSGFTPTVGTALTIVRVASSATRQRP